MQRHGFRTSTKLILWTLFVIQLFLIGIFWVLQGISEQSVLTSGEFTVNFIQFKNRQNIASTEIVNKFIKNDKVEVKLISNFTMDFLTFPESGDEFSENLTCFRQGIVENFFNTGNKHVKKCKCVIEWHGKDCGQPEVIWRTFMTSKIHLIVSSARAEPNKVVFMITGNFYNLELLEIQVMELKDSVDFIIICNKKMKKLKMNFANSFRDRILIVGSNRSLKKNYNCKPKLAYKEFKIALDKKSLSSDDIFVFSQDDEILNHRAIKYFKYYGFPGVMRFRLKYNVYGFYWQHPESTRLGSVASTIGQLERYFKSDPDRLLAVRKPNIIIGDLNHIGGWYCQFCYQPSEIIDRLQMDFYQIFPRAVKNRQIDIRYIQNLIESGLYIDGKLGLNKLHRFSDKYYAPSYVEQNGWKFNNILVNLFLSFEDDYES